MQNILCTDLCSCVIAWHVFGPSLVPSDRCVNGFIRIIISELTANFFPLSITLLQKISQPFVLVAEVCERCEFNQNFGCHSAPSRDFLELCFHVQNNIIFLILKMIQK